MIQTILVVESPNDAAFYKKLYSTAAKEKETNLIDIIEFEDLHNFNYDGKNQRGYSLSCLVKRLKLIKKQMDNGKYKDVNHIAVIVDIDFPPKEGQKPNKKQDGGRGNRLYQISEAINEVFKTQLNLAIKKETLSFSDMKRLYPDEWVLIGNPDLDDTPVLKAVVQKVHSGVVLFHSKTKMDVALHAKEVKTGYDRFVCVYTGEMPKHKRYWLSNW